MLCFSLLSGKNGVGRYCFLVVTFKKEIKSGYFKLQDHFCKQGNSN